MYVCMYVCIRMYHVCMYVCMYTCLWVTFPKMLLSAPVLRFRTIFPSPLMAAARSTASCLILSRSSCAQNNAEQARLGTAWACTHGARVHAELARRDTRLLFGLLLLDLFIRNHLCKVLGAQKVDKVARGHGDHLAVLAHALHSALKEHLHLAGRRLAGFGLGLHDTHGAAPRTRVQSGQL